MSVAYKPDDPDLQTLTLTFGANDAVIERWVSYDFASDFLTPTDSFQLTLGTDEGGLDPEQRKQLKLGNIIRLKIEGLTLADGYIDSVEVSSERSGGWTYTIHGRDILGQTLDTVADPTFQLPTGGTLLDLLKRLFLPFGWTTDEQFIVDNEANRNARSGLRGTPTTKGGKKKGPKPLKSFVLHQTKPYNHESVFHFASRVTQRQGLWLWASADGQSLIVGKPDFDQVPIFDLRRNFNGTGNILSGSVKYDMTDQPAVIIADSFSGGAEFGKGRCRAYIVNPLLGHKSDGDITPEVAALLKKYPSAVKNEIESLFVNPFLAINLDGTPVVPFRAMFLHDDESKTQQELNNFVKREMSLLYRKVLTCHYVVEGHGQTVDGAFVAWAVDTLVDVFDEPTELSETMYVLGVRFLKQRGGSGTTTRLDLVRLRSIQF